MARDDDEEPSSKRVNLGSGAAKDLTPLSVAELEAHIHVLEAEIARIRAAIEAKRSHRSGAEGLFKR
jgi:uncharacterized small protein (DUF1192 family)